eukprot:Seg4643.3 transcript_id=Seg4643.3/GoldUCD/mRNA.D3Y31 product="DNA mismatch repair protein Mlh3" protein_id=Seg4643.3/GoldUCD/D3Y31
MDKNSCKEYCTNSMQNNGMIDPLTGRRMQLALQNGFGTFESSSLLDECKFTVLTPKPRGYQRGPMFGGNILECTLKHQGDLSAKRDTSNKHYFNDKILDSARFTGNDQYSGKNEAYVGNFFKEWVNPVFGVAKDTELDAQIKGTLQKPRKLAGEMQGLQLKRELFENIDVIEQVDNKFIACKVSMKTKASKKNYLLLVDQHAAHERIRLENLQKEFLQEFHGSTGKKTIGSKQLIPPLELSLTLPQDQCLGSFKDAFAKIGVRFAIQNETTIEENIYISILITELPKLFVKPKNPMSCETETVLESSTLKAMFYEHIKKYRESSFTVSVIPPAINNVLCSFACHGAIRFGDALTLAECKSIIGSLAHCKLPFQCAHGRPSIAPLLDLNSTEQLASCEDAKKPKLWKLRR